MKQLIFITFLSCPFLLFGQGNIDTLHTSVGDTINGIEKSKYYLHNSINDSLFSFSLFYKINDSIFYNAIHLIDGTTVKDTLKNADIQKLKENISKFDAYYLYLSTKDSILINKLDSGIIFNSSNKNNLNKSMEALNTKQHKEELKNAYNTSAKRVNEIYETQKRLRNLGPPR